MTIFARRCDICRIPRLRAIPTLPHWMVFCESGVKLAEQRIAEVDTRIRGNPEMKF